MEVSVSGTGIIRAEFDNEQVGRQAIIRIIEDNGLKVLASFQPLVKTSNSDNECCAHDHVSDNKIDDHDHDHDHAHDHDHTHGEAAAGFQQYSAPALSFCMLLAGIIADHFIHPSFFSGWLRLLWYSLAYIPVGYPVVKRGLIYALKGDVFTEFILMGIATLGAFAIGEYPEGVAVMLFYTIGELFQDAAVNKAKRSIKSLLDVRPKTAAVLRNGNYIQISPDEVAIEETIQVKAGERVPLDGQLLNERSSFNTAALTGESKPSTIEKGETVLAGMINQEKVVEVKVTKLFNDSSLARILTLVQEATTRKAKTELFIRKFSRVYTPIVVFLATAIVLLPALIVQDYIFRDWLYRALVFLVVSCPCALVISIPLGYFGGIGAASRAGILFKGSNFLDLIGKVNYVVMDKTGTLTKGVFQVQNVINFTGDKTDWLKAAAALESKSTHPVAKAIVDYAGNDVNLEISNPEEIAGGGMKGLLNGKEIFAGNSKLMKMAGISIPDDVTALTDTVVMVAIDGVLLGYLVIADEIKGDSKAAVEALHRRNIQTIMLSGDKQTVVNRIANELKIDSAFGDLLPEGKVEKVSALKGDPKNIVAFVGDGLNDAPVLALSDIGIAMGGLGSDAAIETADVIIQTDQPSKIAQAIEIGKETNRIVWQNITMAFIVKAIVLILGAGGLATMWEAVFADVGVAMLAILNAIRIQKKNFSDY
ncbi:cadmium-translocating P-type ATPase [Pedobacter sp. HMF7647]|uniref:P-type Zn(2+) transporter n=2 Tax=Hufsiella arboris TaxID=2695275 RepID=A0A7K1Y7Q0_9SPHI|nr:cadmium-translocating P-type ATPase [Hufsiella arboris]